jgi:hypothetical protein
MLQKATISLYSTASRKCASGDAGGDAILRGVRTRYRAAVAVLTVALFVTPLSAGAAKKPSKPAAPNLKSGGLWATIDVCNTAAHPNTVGIRGSMPGTGDKHESMYMAFIVEYRSSRGAWLHFKSGGQSNWSAVGSARASTRQAGQNFQLSAHFRSTETLRGVVLYQWRLNGHVVTDTVRASSSGHAPAAGSDPPGFSAAFCTIQPNSRGSLLITPVTPSA